MRITETTVTVHDVMQDPRFHAMLQRFHWHETNQSAGAYTIIANRSQTVGLFLEQLGRGYIRVSTKSIAHAGDNEFESRTCSSLFSALSACYQFMQEYMDVNPYANHNRF